MKPWHPSWIWRIALRLVGLGLIATLWPEGRWLRALVHAHPAITGGQMMLAALSFLCASGGAALLLMGPDLWRPVRLSARWTAQARS